MVRTGIVVSGSTPPPPAQVLPGFSSTADTVTQIGRGTLKKENNSADGWVKAGVTIGGAALLCVFAPEVALFFGVLIGTPALITAAFGGDKPITSEKTVVWSRFGVPPYTQDPADREE